MRTRCEWLVAASEVVGILGALEWVRRVKPIRRWTQLSTMFMYIIIGIKIGGDIFINNWKTTYGELCQQSQMWCLWYVNKFVRGSMCLRIVIQDVEWSIIIWLSMWFLFGLDNHLRNSQQDIYLKCLLKVHSWFQMYP